VIRTVLALAAALAAVPAAAQQAARAPTVVADAEKGKIAAEQLEAMRASLKLVLARAEAARGQKDVARLNCVNEKLTQIRAFLRVAEQAGTAMSEALAKSDASAETEFAKVTIARNRVDGLRDESEKCVALAGYAPNGRTSVAVRPPAGLPEPSPPPGDDANRPAAAAPPVVRPPPASPYR
jgi:hypothetical protein